MHSDRTNTKAITLTTDFGETDSYVAAMKGVLTRLAPGVPILDLAHAMPPQDVYEAAYFISGCVPWFPKGTIHIVVVDPGVGTTRRPIAVRWREQTLVGPDNGLFTMLARLEPFEAVRTIEHPACRLESVSATFHGRDIFAPAGAQLASGLPFETIGPLVLDPVMLTLPEPKRQGNAIWGEVIHIDHFGNAITNIPASDINPGSGCVVTAGAHTLSGIAKSYGNVAPGTPLALIGSGGFVEIAVNEGNAHALLHVDRGTLVRIEA